MGTRISFLMQATTAPPDRTSAAPHSAGWSESWWLPGTVNSDSPLITQLAQKRASLLPSQASVIGFRLALYTLTGNKIVPGGTKTGKFLYPGAGHIATDLPQVALEMSGKTGAGPNTSRFTLRGMPDGMMTYGEYQPDTTFRGAVTRFCTELIDSGWCFLGRDLSNPVVRVLSIAAGNVTVSAGMGVAVGDYIRLLRVFDNNGNSVQGSYRVTAFAGAGVMTLAGFDPAITAGESGSARKDTLALYGFSAVTPSRAVVRKVGRPFESYRGRRSKR